MFSYSGDPRGSDKDLVRFLVGDTTSALSLISDEEICYLLTAYPAPKVAARYALEGMLAKVAQDTLVSADGIVRDLSGRRAAMQARLDTLKREQTYLGAIPFVGGTSIAERDDRREDETLVQPAFTRDQFSDPGDHTQEESWRSD